MNRGNISIDKRWKIVDLLKENMSLKEISDLMGLSLKTIERIKDIHEQTGLVSLPYKRKSSPDGSNPDDSQVEITEIDSENNDQNENQPVKVVIPNGLKKRGRPKKTDLSLNILSKSLNLGPKKRGRPPKIPAHSFIGLHSREHYDQVIRDSAVNIDQDEMDDDLNDDNMSDNSSIADLNLNYYPSRNSNETKPVDSRARIIKNCIRKGEESFEIPTLTVMGMLKRRQWCKERLNWTLEDWKKVIFSDQSYFEIVNLSGIPTIKRFRQDKLDSLSSSTSHGVGIWCSLSYEGIGSCSLYEGSIEEELYLQILEERLEISGDLFFGKNKNFLFQPYGEFNKIDSVKSWCDSREITLLPCCEYSPDLNPLEHAWRFVESRLAQLRVESNEKLKKVIQNIWFEIPSVYLKKLIKSMPYRVRACYNAKGGHFKI